MVRLGVSCMNTWLPVRQPTEHVLGSMAWITYGCHGQASSNRTQESIFSIYLLGFPFLNFVSG